MNEHVLLVEDDNKLAHLLVELLEGHGWSVTLSRTGEDALEVIEAAQPDLVLLDLMLPGIDGIEVCRRIRKMYQTKILMLTALGSDTDQILGLEVGADDYLVKTVPTRLLLARIRALLRQQTPQSDNNDMIEMGWCRIQINQQRVWLKNNEAEQYQEILITSAEFEDLALLVADAGSVVSRELIFEKLFDRPYESTDRTIDRRIVRLRKSLHDTQGKYIRTVRGTGYYVIKE